MPTQWKLNDTLQTETQEVILQTLRNENLQVPGGFRFRQAEIKWDSTKVLGLHPSLDVLTRAVISARKANPHYVEKYKWKTDFDSVRMEVKAFQVKICQSMGWQSYLTEGGGGAPPPLASRRSPQEEGLLAAAAKKAKLLWAGITTNRDFIESGEPPVPQDQAEARAATCIKCPQHGKGDFTTFFTAPAAAAIQRQLETLHGRNIRTSVDDQLNTCTVCLCPIQLKAHFPLKFIKANLSDETLTALRAVPDCWIPKELDAV
jgi:hypothetical protein